MDMKEKSICRAKLLNGAIVFYDLCGESKKDYSDIENKEYLGEGTIYEVNGVQQSFTEIEHFWKFKS